MIYLLKTKKSFRMMIYIIVGVEQLVARQPHKLEVICSNQIHATNSSKRDALQKNISLFLGNDILVGMR